MRLLWQQCEAGVRLPRCRRGRVHRRGRAGERPRPRSADPRMDRGNARSGFRAPVQAFRHRSAAAAGGRFGWRFALLGVQLAPGADCRLAHVHDDTPAQAAGLSAGDVVVARWRTARNTRQLRQAADCATRAGDRVELVGFRRDELMHIDVVLAQRPPLKTTLVTDPGAKTAAVRLRRGWLGQS